MSRPTPVRRPRPRRFVLTRILIIKLVIWPLALIPAARLVLGGLFYVPSTRSYVRPYTDGLTANPVDYLTDQTGTWALAFLVISLAVTPIRRLTRWNDVIRLRRLLGLFSFFYALLHLLTWAVIDKFFDVAWMWEDILERPFITVGMATFLILLALAITSTKGWIRRLGRKWQRLHQLVYLAAIGGVVHFWWLVKADITEPRRWMLALVVLFGIRIWWTFRKRLLSPS